MLFDAVLGFMFFQVSSCGFGCCSWAKARGLVGLVRLRNPKPETPNPLKPLPSSWDPQACFEFPAGPDAFGSQLFGRSGFEENGK